MVHHLPNLSDLAVMERKREKCGPEGLWMMGDHDSVACYTEHSHSLTDQMA